MAFLNGCARVGRRLPPSRTKVRVGRVLAGVGARFGASPFCTSELNDGCVVELDARSRTEAGALWNGSHDPDLQLLLLELAEAYGNCLYDVGANVGLVGIPLARQLGDQSRVCFFEPVPENAARLRRNIELNHLGNCTVVEVALAAEPGRLQIARETTFGASTGNAVIVTQSSSLPHYGAICEVPVEPLDAVVHAHSLRPPDVIKLDIEGSEVGFVRGAEETLAKARPVIVGEFNSGLMPRFGTSFPDVARLLPPDYRVFAFVGALQVVEREPEEGLGNALLVPSEKLPTLPLRVHR